MCDGFVGTNHEGYRLSKVTWQKTNRSRCYLGAYFLWFMCVQLVPYTFSVDPTVAQLQACFAAIPIATTFWFAVNMFMIVLSDQRRQKKEAK